jgi:hypothetical protein
VEPRLSRKNFCYCATCRGRNIRAVIAGRAHDQIHDVAHGRLVAIRPYRSCRARTVRKVALLDSMTGSGSWSIPAVPGGAPSRTLALHRCRCSLKGQTGGAACSIGNIYSASGGDSKLIRGAY